jgi:selenocysteine lyase/cysteine desulfurase
LPKPCIAIAPDDERFWSEVGAQYTPSPDFINLENGYFGMPANPVRAALRRYQDTVDAENGYFLRVRWNECFSRVRNALAAFTGVGADELLVTRSAVESLNILLQGYPFVAGDETLYARHDYDSAHAIIGMLEVRKGINPIEVDVPLNPPSDDTIVDIYAAAITPRTRLLLLTHIVHRTGQIMPVAAIAAMARARGVDVIVDAAHSLAQLDYQVPQLGAQFVVFNLHKWVGAPLGTGLLYIARERIADIAPLYGDMRQNLGDIDKLGHVGVVPPAPVMAIEDALTFHNQIGTANKEARLRWLARRWMDAVCDVPHVRLHTPREPSHHCAVGAFSIDGLAAPEVVRRLMDEHRIFTVVRQLGDTSGVREVVRVTPHLYTRSEDMDTLTAAIRALALSV